MPTTVTWSAARTDDIFRAAVLTLIRSVPAGSGRTWARLAPLLADPPDTLAQAGPAGRVLAARLHPWTRSAGSPGMPAGAFLLHPGQDDPAGLAVPPPPGIPGPSPGTRPLGRPGGGHRADHEVPAAPRPGHSRGDAAHCTFSVSGSRFRPYGRS